MLEKYKTIYNTGIGEIIEKKSRFIGCAMPVYSDEEAHVFIGKIRKENSSASHNVFAYQIGERNQTKRYSDDGEPSATAGIPILSILENENIQNTVIVVTRYFGGTLLGTGGLVRAYQASAKEALKEAVIIEKFLVHKFSLTVDYNLSGKIQYFILNNKGIITDTNFTELVEYIILINSNEVDFFIEGIKDLTSGNIEPIFIEKVYKATINNEVKIFNN